MAFRFLILLFCLFFNLAKPGFTTPWGKDSEMYKQIDDYKSPKKNNSYLHYLFENIILFHQNILSPVDGPRSHFRPTSARYMFLSLRRHGFCKGYIKGCDRLLRENKDPWVYRFIVINNKRYKFDPTF